ncbi:MAG: hypothetical protein WC860_09660, partial [Candidatus Margulisiibacteriota bacterium]
MKLFFSTLCLTVFILFCAHALSAAEIEPRLASENIFPYTVTEDASLYEEVGSTLNSKEDIYYLNASLERLEKEVALLEKIVTKIDLNTLDVKDESFFLEV